MPTKTVLIVTAVVAVLFFSGGLYSYHLIFSLPKVVAAKAPIAPSAPTTVTKTIYVPVESIRTITKTMFRDTGSVRTLVVDTLPVASFNTTHGDSVNIAYDSGRDSLMVTERAGPPISPDTLQTIVYNAVPFIQASPLLFIGQDSRYSGGAGVGFETVISGTFRVSIEAGFAIKSTPFYGITWRYLIPWLKIG